MSALRIELLQTEQDLLLEQLAAASERRRCGGTVTAGGGGGGRERRPTRKRVRWGDEYGCGEGNGMSEEAAAAAAAAAEEEEATGNEVLCVLEERVPLELVRWLVANPHVIEKRSERAKFARFARVCESGGGVVRSRYTHRGANCDAGRLYTTHQCGLSNLSVALSNTLAVRHYVVVDCRNCHPFLSLLLAHEWGVPAPCLERVVHEREQVLRELSGRSRAEAKGDLLVTMYGGDAERHAEQQLPPFVRRYRAELRRLREMALERGAERHAQLQARRPGRPMNAASYYGYVMQEMESTILERARRFFEERGRPVGALKHDGILLARDAAGRAPPPAEMAELSELIAAELHMPGLCMRVQPYAEFLCGLPPEIEQLIGIRDGAEVAVAAAAAVGAGDGE